MKIEQRVSPENFEQFKRTQKTSLIPYGAVLPPGATFLVFTDTGAGAVAKAGNGHEVSLVPTPEKDIEKHMLEMLEKTLKSPVSKEALGLKKINATTVQAAITKCLPKIEPEKLKPWGKELLGRLQSPAR